MPGSVGLGDPFQSRRPALAHAVAALAVSLLLPPLLTAALGGADLDLAPGLRVEWYDAAGAALGLAGALAALSAAPRGGRLLRALHLLAALQFVLVAAVAWGGGFRNEWLSVRDPLRPAALGWVLLALSALRGVGLAGPARHAVRVARIALPVAAGALLFQGASALDAADLSRRIAAPRPEGEGPDLVFVLVDTLRADSLGIYGAEPSPSSALDAWAARSVVFRRTMAQAPWTFPSVWSLMTARHPSALGPAMSPGAPGGHASLPVMGPSVPRLAAALRSAGYHTAGFVKNRFLMPGFGMEAGFDVYEIVNGDRAEQDSGAQLVAAVLRWARLLAEHRRRGDAKPFFLYVHFMDPHVNYQPPAEFVPPEARAYRGPFDGSAKALRRLSERGTATPDDIAQMRALYRGEVIYVDRQIERLRLALQELGLRGEGTVEVFTSDHGEQFGEHGDFSHEDMHVENLHVPLWITAPGLAPREVDALARLIDVAPTLLELLGLQPLEGAEGRSLTPLLRGEALAALPALSEYGERRRVTETRYSLIAEPQAEELYDLEEDPDERRDLRETHPAPLSGLRELLRRHEEREVAPADAGEARPLDAETREALEALGYL